ncbi:MULTISPECIES: BON domain-containing protein [unclassified Luteimonas]
MKTSRIPLAIALSSALALAVGCAADRDNQAAADGNADITPATTPADQTTAPPVAPITADATTTDPAMGATADAGPGDGLDSDQPVDDTWITTKVKSSLLAESEVSGLDINVDTLNGVVTLRGQVESQAQIDTATRIAREIKGVSNVDASGLTVGAAANE